MTMNLSFAMSRLRRTLVLLGACLCLQTTSAEPLRLVGDIWPPFTDATLINGGLATDLVSTALARAGYASGFEQVPWARAMQGLSNGRYDVLVNAWYNDERLKVGQFSAPYLHNKLRFIRRKDSPVEYNNLEQLMGYAIAYVPGYAYSAAFDSNKQLNKVPVHNFAMAVRMLAAGRVSLTLEDEYVARYRLARESARVRNALEFLPKPVSENQLHILVSLKTPEHDKIVADFDREIIAMKADGSYARLIKEHGM